MTVEIDLLDEIRVGVVGEGFVAGWVLKPGSAKLYADFVRNRDTTAVYGQNSYEFRYAHCPAIARERASG